MDNNKALLDNIIEGIQDKKGSNIVVADLNKIETRICNYFVICQGNTPNQTTAIAKSIGDKLRETSATKPYAVSGIDNGQWIAMDYGDVFVHIFLPDEREFYDLEHLWADATLTNIPDID
jgi:ribosome-associated protein